MGGWRSNMLHCLRISELSLSKGLELPPDTDIDRSLKSLADEARIPRPQYVQRVQRVIAEHGPVGEAERENASSSWFGAIADQVLTWLLISGYAALGLTLCSVRSAHPRLPGWRWRSPALVTQGRWDWKWPVRSQWLRRSSVISPVTALAACLARRFSKSVAIRSAIRRRACQLSQAVRSLGLAHRVHHADFRLVSQFDREPFRRRKWLSSFQVPGSCGDRAAAMEFGLYGPWISCRRRPGSSCQLPDKSQPLVLDSGGLRRLRSARVPAHGRCAG